MSGLDAVYSPFFFFFFFFLSGTSPDLKHKTWVSKHSPLPYIEAAEDFCLP